eukprot:c21985_g4_i3.p1 GENE.c21985_g4_i3~~c21985_g4_i3.p1  ORF type:complete len:509 (-),score=104.38 c21985_g4_i3:130-1629(-)
MAFRPTTRTTIHILILIGLFCFAQSTILEIFSSNSSIPTIYEINTPHFDLGNKSFPVSSSGVIFSKNCNAFNLISDEQVQLVKTQTNSSKLIVLIQFDDQASYAKCFPQKYVFECQKRDWCDAVLLQDPFRTPAGFTMWSLIDEFRPRSDYKVPMLESNKEDFDLFKKLILQSQINNQTYRITLTNDENKWEGVFKSVPFLIYFRVLSPLWSLGCLVLIILVFWKKGPTPSRRDSDVDKNSRKEPPNVERLYSRNILKKRLTLKQICLVFHFITHLARVILYSIDPIQSQQIFTYIVAQLLTATTFSFEIATHILLSIIMRELTQTNTLVDIRKRTQFAYVIIIVFLFFDYFSSTLAGLRSDVPFSTSIVMLVFYIGGNIVLGIWYFWQAYRFLRKCNENEKVVKRKSNPRIRLTQISLLNSIGMITFGLLCLMILVRNIFGNPWGYSFAYMSFIFVVQIMSFCEILIFGGVLFRPPTLKNSVQLLRYSLRDANTTLSL